MVAVGEDRDDSALPKEVLMNQQFAQMSFFSDSHADVECKPVSSQPTMDSHIELEEDIPDLIMEQGMHHNTVLLINLKLPRYTYFILL